MEEMMPSKFLSVSICVICGFSSWVFSGIRLEREKLKNPAVFPADIYDLVFNQLDFRD